MHDYDVIGVLYSSAHFTLFASARYWLYKDSLRIPARWMYLILTAIIMGCGCLWLISGGIPGITFYNIRVSLALPAFLLSCFIIKEPFAKHAFSYTVIFSYDVLLEAIANYLQARLNPGNVSYVYTLTLFLLTAITFVPAFYFLKKMIIRLSEVKSSKIWSCLCLCCFSFLIMNTILTLSQTIDIRFLLSRFFMLTGMTGMYLVAIQLMDSMHTSALISAELELTEQRITMQQNYYDRLVLQMDEIRRMRHDLHHHQAVLTGIAKTRDVDAISEYLSSIDSPAPAVPVTGNLAIDSILLYYMDAAKALGTTIETSFSLKGKLPLSDPDLCIILGNLLENAVEAQKHVSPEHRFIRIAAHSKENTFTLAIDNRFDGTLYQGQKSHEASSPRTILYASRKDTSGHGLGLSSVQTLCEKYGGILQVETEADLFLTGVVIGL